MNVPLHKYNLIDKSHFKWFHVKIRDDNQIDGGKLVTTAALTLPENAGGEVEHHPFAEKHRRLLLHLYNEVVAGCGGAASIIHYAFAILVRRKNFLVFERYSVYNHLPVKQGIKEFP